MQTIFQNSPQFTLLNVLHGHSLILIRRAISIQQLALALRQKMAGTSAALEGVYVKPMDYLLLLRVVDIFGGWSA